MKKNLQNSVKRGFTLVEILVSLTVLSLLVFLVANITNSATIGISGGQNRIEADSEARSVFNRLAIDLARMLRRADLDYSSFKQTGNTQVGNDHFTFYAEVPGYFTGGFNTMSPYSVVGYQAASGGTYFPGTVLQRASKGLAWDRPISVGAMPVLSGTDYQTVGPQVFRMEYTYLLKPTASSGPTLSITPGTSVRGLKEVGAIVVGIAVLDSSNRALSQSAGGGTLTDTTLISQFPDVAAGSDVLATWTPKIASGGIAGTAGIPAKAASAIRVYQRYFYLDKQ